MRGSKAVVVGAGIGGLCAAQALSRLYEQVLVVERDTPPMAPRPRPGVPQGRHLHTLLAGGVLAAGQLFPGLMEDLQSDGATTGDVLADGRSYFEGHRLAKTHGDVPAVSLTQPYLEWQLRRQLAGKANVRMLTSRSVVGLRASGDGRRIASVLLGGTADRSNGDEHAEALPCDLVVDASGRGSRTPEWLTHLGYRPPAEQRVEVGLSYASWFLTAPDDLLGGDLGVVIGFTREIPRAGSVVRVEGGRWMAAMAGYPGHAPPSTVEECLDFARRLAAPDVYHALREATSQDGPAHFRFRSSTRRLYHRLDRFPDGLVVLGDAACCFNPVYGQGMAVAALQALAMRQALARPGRSTASLRGAIARAAAVAWAMSTGNDLRLP
jgi:2-polyprenyl-6-methoxyphenol hydroxylase-like FAD-dependent oxidoreductase